MYITQVHLDNRQPQRLSPAKYNCKFIGQIRHIVPLKILILSVSVSVFDWDFRPNRHDVGTIWHCLIYIHITKNGSIIKLMVLSESSYAKTYGWTSKSSFYVYRFGRYETLCEKSQNMAAILDFRLFKYHHFDSNDLLTPQHHLR